MNGILGRSAMGIGAIMSGLVGVAAAGIRLNTTPSVPLGIWRVAAVAGVPARGSVVSMCLPPEVAAEGRRGGMLARGWCPDGSVAVLKPLAAVPGDVVSIGPDGITVNGAWSAPAGLTQLGPQEPGDRVVPAGHGWLLGPHPHGWDGRYFGAVPLAGINGVAQPIWTWGG